MSNKIAKYVGDDGTLYFNYGVGLKFRLKQKSGEECIIEITDCFLKSDGETEYYKGKKNNTVLDKPFSANRLKFLLNNQCIEVLCEGVRQEMPVLTEEVDLYYSKFVKPLALKKAAAEKALKCTNYFEIRAELIGLLVGRTVEQREEKIAAKEKERAEILKRLNIDPALLETEELCYKCCGTGFDVGASSIKPVFCECVLKRLPQIKQFCKNERLNKKQN